MTYKYDGAEPEVDDGAFVSSEATLIGNVTVARGASIWPGAVLRGDVAEVHIQEYATVEEQCVVHGAEIGPKVVLGHGAVLETASIGEGCLVGSNSTVNIDVEVGDQCIIASGAVIPDGRTIPNESFVAGVPATVTPLSKSSVDHERVFSFYAADQAEELISNHDGLFDR